MCTQHVHTTTHTCAPTATHTTHRHTWTCVFTPHGRPECPHSWHTAFPGTNWLRGGLCRFERNRTLGWGGGPGVPGGREELGLRRVPGWQGQVQRGGPALEVTPVEAEPCHRGRAWKARTRRVPPPRHLLEHRAGRSTTERAAAHRVQAKETQVLVSLGLRTDSRRWGNKHSLSAPASMKSRASQHRPPEPAARRQAALGTG